MGIRSKNIAPNIYTYFLNFFSEKQTNHMYAIKGNASIKNRLPKEGIIIVKLTKLMMTNKKRNIFSHFVPLIQ